MLVLVLGASRGDSHAPPARGSGRSTEGKKPQNHRMQVIVTCLEHSAQTPLEANSPGLSHLHHLPETSGASRSESPFLGTPVRRAPRAPHSLHTSVKTPVLVACAVVACAALARSPDETWLPRERSHGCHRPQPPRL